MSGYNNALVNQMIAAGTAGSREANDRLYAKVAAGDAEARQVMIKGNMSLVLDKVESYIRCYPSTAHLRDDMVSEGFLGLTTAVNKMAAAGPQENPNPTGYISHWVTKHIGLAIEAESGTGGSATTSWRKADRGEEMVQLVQMPVELVQLEEDPTRMIDLRDMISHCCETDEDRLIVDMREKGYSYKEIAARLDLPLTTTYMLLRDIYTRFLAVSGMDGEV